MRKASRWRLLPALGIAAAFVLSLTPAASASPTQGSCVLSLSTGKRACFSTTAAAFKQVDNSNETRAGVLYTKENFGGQALVLAIAKDCVKDGWMDYWWNFTTADPWYHNVHSLTVYGKCALWLYESGDVRDGPYERDLIQMPDKWASSVVTVGAS